MKILVTVVYNAFILYFLQYAFLYLGIPDAIDTGSGTFFGGLWKVYLIGGLILGFMNLYIRPILKLIGLPFRILTFGLFIFVIDGLILLFFSRILDAINIAGVFYQINGAINFVIAVAIFTLLNTLYHILIK